jgi:DNA-dependent protein kinase catalytic subunit
MTKQERIQCKFEIKKRHHLPRFLNTFASFLLEIDEIDEWILEYLEKIIEILFIVFPKQIMFPKYRSSNCYSLVKIFISLSYKKNSLDILLSKIGKNYILKIVFKGLTLAISSKSSIGDDIDITILESNEGLYNDYLELFFFVLRKVDLKNYNVPWCDLSFNDETQDKMHLLIYNKIIENSITILNLLDLRCVEKSEEEILKTTSTSEIYNIQPKNAKDYELFLNLVEFLKKFILKSEKKYFINWVLIFTKNMIEKSINFPYVSGFYKLLETSMKICDEFNYFDSIKDTTGTFIFNF